MRSRVGSLCTHPPSARYRGGILETLPRRIPHLLDSCPKHVRSHRCPTSIVSCQANSDGWPREACRHGCRSRSRPRSRTLSSRPYSLSARGCSCSSRCQRLPSSPSYNRFLWRWETKRRRACRDRRPRSRRVGTHSGIRRSPPLPGLPTRGTSAATACGSTRAPESPDRHSRDVA